MAAGNFLKCQAVTGKWEGGWSDHPADPGGKTMYGVTLAKYREHYPNATAAQLRVISRESAADIFRQDFWNPIGGESLPAGVDLAAYDASVNSGVSRGRAWLAASTSGSPVDTVKKLCAKRLGFMQSLKIWKSFGKGWAARVADIEAKGVAWALAAATNPQVTKTVLKDHADDAGKKAGGQAAGAGGAVVTAPAANTVIPADHTASLLLLAAVVGIVFGLLIWRAHINRQRALAYAAEAAKL